MVFIVEDGCGSDISQGLAVVMSNLIAGLIKH